MKYKDAPTTCTSLTKVQLHFSPQGPSTAAPLADNYTTRCPSITEHGGSASADGDEILWISEGPINERISITFGTSSATLL